MNEAKTIQIALTVESLRQAENLYILLFDLEVRAREAIGGELAPPEEYDEGGPLASHRSILEGNGLCLALQVGVVENPLGGRVAHIGIRYARPDLNRVRARARDLCCQILTEDEDSLLLEDPLGLRWHLQSDTRTG